MYLSVLQSVVEDVDLHKGSLDRLEAAVGAVLPLLDEPDQDQLRAQLEDLTNQYNCHAFNSEGYLVERWVEGKEAELVAMAPIAVQPPAVQVSFTIFILTFCKTSCRGYQVLPDLLLGSVISQGLNRFTNDSYPTKKFDPYL